MSAPEGEFIPTTENVEDGYADDPESEYRDPINYGSTVQANRRAFRRWLAQHDREVAEKTLRVTGEVFRQAVEAGVEPVLNRTVAQLLHRRADAVSRGTAWGGLEPAPVLESAPMEGATPELTMLMGQARRAIEQGATK